MSAIGLVPVTIAPEAAARVAALGIQAELDRMLERVRQVVPQLGSIDVTLQERYEPGDEPAVSVNARTRLSWQQANEVWWPIARWQGDTFPPQVLEHLSIEVYSGGADAGASVPGPGAGGGTGQR
jgi:hypothetical protein